MDYCYVSPVHRLCHDDGRLWWEKDKSDEWVTTFIPALSFPEENPPETVLTLKFDGDDSPRMVEVVNTRTGDTVYDDVMSRLESFLTDHAPWVAGIDLGDDFLDGYVREVYGRYAPDDLTWIARAQLATTGFLTDLGNYAAAFNDGFYQDTNIIPGYDVACSGDLRDGLYIATGKYSRPLARKIRKCLSNSHDLLSILTLLKYSRGLSPEHIIQLLDERVFLDFPDAVIYNGTPRRGRDAYIPDWLISSLPHHHMEWLKDIDFLFDVIRMMEFHDIDVSDLDISTSDIFYIHNQILDHDNYLDYLSRVELGKNDMYEIDDVVVDQRKFHVLSSSVEMIDVGNAMNVCIGSGCYIDKMLSGKSLFITGSKGGRPDILAEVDVKTGGIIEQRGISNSDLHSDQVDTVRKVADSILEDVRQVFDRDEEMVLV